MSRENDLLQDTIQPVETRTPVSSPPQFTPPPVPGLMAACQVKIEFLLTDPSQFYVYPVPSFCAPGFEVALAAVLASLLKASYVYPLGGR